MPSILRPTFDFWTGAWLQGMWPICKASQRIQKPKVGASEGFHAEALAPAKSGLEYALHVLRPVFWFLGPLHETELYGMRES